MAMYGYIEVEGDIWLVTVHRDSHTRSVKRRSSGAMGNYLVDVQKALDKRENEALIEALRWGKQVNVPLARP
jgi:hypothetical protein